VTSSDDVAKLVVFCLLRSQGAGIVDGPKLVREGYE